MPDPCKKLCAITFGFGLLCLPVLRGQSAQSALPAISSSSTNEQAHALLDSARKVNSLFSDDLKPWHLIATVTHIWRNPKPLPEKVEVWSAGRYKWRTIGELEGKQSGEWSKSRTEHYLSHRFYSTVWEPFSNSLDVAGYLQPDIEMELKHLEVGVSLDCISVVHPERYAKSATRFFYPSLCFDKKIRLRLISFGQIISQYDSYRTFQGREVAGHVKISTNGNTLTEAKLDVLDIPSKIEEQTFTPDQDAIKDSYTRRPDDPEPVAIHQEAGATYLSADRVRPNLLVLISAILQKDGSVKVPKNATVSYRQADGQVRDIFGTANGVSNNLSVAPRLEPMTAAAGRWKFEPYKVDGELVDTWIMIAFTEDGKPWKP